MPAIKVSARTFADGYRSMMQELPALEARLASIRVPVGFVAGEAGPMPLDQASKATADRIPSAWVEVVAGAGHFVWLRTPGRRPHGTRPASEDGVGGHAHRVRPCGRVGG